MAGLAEYEGYAPSFRVDESTLLEQGFRKQPPDFTALVAEGPDGEIQGLLVYFLIAFTFRARPTLYMKELFVRPECRGRGVGEALMKAAEEAARAHGCACVRWQVARWNAAAIRFYERLGARADPEWVNYELLLSPPES
jgi:ribosomal protein S18 acetylase RimI-like enzyme